MHRKIVDRQAQVEVVLNSILDPCSCTAGAPAGLMDLGLVRDLRVSEINGDHRVDVALTITVTEPTCVMSFPFANEARTQLETLDFVRDVDVAIDHSVVWDEHSMSPQYRSRLAAHRATKRRAIELRTDRASPRSSLNDIVAVPSSNTTGARPFLPREGP